MQICDFKGSRRIGKPRNWDNDLDGECLDIFVADAVDILTGMPIMYTAYKLSEDEIKALANGGSLRLGIAGKSHPVFQLHVLGPDITASAGLRPAGDLGEVIGTVE